MKYIVIKTFQDITGLKMPGEPIELTDDRAAKLRVNGLIGGQYVETAKSIESEETVELEPSIEAPDEPEPVELDKQTDLVEPEANIDELESTKSEHIEEGTKKKVK